MSIHIAAEKGQIADTVLLPGDPLRAKYIAEKFLSEVTCYNTTRGMLGYTGVHKNRRISVQGSGMGMPSLGIYVNELAHYDVTKIIRVGTCGALQNYLELGDIILAQGACSESGMNRRRFKGMDYAPLANWRLLDNASWAAGRFVCPVTIGNILAADLFYNDHAPDEWKLWAEYGVLAVEMESAELYTLAAKFRIQALSILTVSDSLPNGGQMPASDRERSLDMMAKIALEASLR